MDAYAISAIILFIIGYTAITLEHKLGTHKSAIALALGGALWILTAFSPVSKEEISHHLHDAGAEIFSIVAFLLAAMALVEILIHYRFFDIIRQWLSKMKLRDKKQFIIIGFLTFFLSAVLDNLTITIVMIQIARRFFKDNNLLIVTAGIVILANAGGAWSPIGDVTTIMLWLAHKFDAMEVIVQGFIPAAVIGLVSGSLLVRQMKDTTFNMAGEEKIVLSRGEKIVITLALASFSLPLIMNLLGLQPYLGLLYGLGVVWLFIEFSKIRSQRKTHLEANIDHFLQKTDISSLKFFIGILLSVSALQALGILEQLSVLVFGEHQETNRIILGNILLGPLSSIVDNVPLTALAIDIINTPNTSLWVLLALSVGTGGSLLIIGSVAGVVAMGMIKELTFEKYLKIASFPAFAGFVAGMITWLIQYQLIS